MSIMERKICTKCGEDKPITEFNWRDKKKGRKHSNCKSCVSKRDKEKYDTNSERRKKVRERALVAYKRNREFVQRVKRLSKCSKCSEDRWYCLDFHHCGGKDLEISDMVTGFSIERIKNEMRKCEILCANCHREEHYKNGY